MLSPIAQRFVLPPSDNTLGSAEPSASIAVEIASSSGSSPGEAAKDTPDTYSISMARTSARYADESILVEQLHVAMTMDVDIRLSLADQRLQSDADCMTCETR